VYRGFGRMTSTMPPRRAELISTRPLRDVFQLRSTNCRPYGM
jgi:hypothetical protein